MPKRLVGAAIEEAETLRRTVAGIPVVQYSADVLNTSQVDYVCKVPSEYRRDRVLLRVISREVDSALLTAAIIGVWRGMKA